MVLLQIRTRPDSEGKMDEGEKRGRTDTEETGVEVEEEDDEEAGGEDDDENARTTWVIFTGSVAVFGIRDG